MLFEKSPNCKGNYNSHGAEKSSANIGTCS